MGSQQNWNDVGRQIRDAVQGALVSGDFKEMNQIVSASVTRALSEAKRQVSEAMAGISKEPAREESHSQEKTRTQTTVKNKMPKIKIKKVGSVTGILMMVFGGIGAGICAPAVLGALVYLLTDQLVVPALGAVLFLTGFIVMIQRGAMRRKRIKRAERYAELCREKGYIDIDELALHTGQSEKYVLKDVKKMIRLGIFPEGHLDEQERCLMLSDETFREYLRLQKERKALELEEKVAKMQEKQRASGQTVFGKQEEAKNAFSESAQEAEAEDPELAAMIREGNDCIRRLRDMNDVIEGEVISAKLFQLENLLKEIFERVKEHPEQMPQMQKFMNYYLPTTLKLVEAYAEFDEVSVPGEDITLAKQEIEKTLDTINQAFAELLNKLFRASVFDVTTDAQVLQTMLAKEGLTGNGEFEKIQR